MSIVKMSLNLEIDTDTHQPRVVMAGQPTVVGTRPAWYHALIAMGLTKEDPPAGVCWRLACQAPVGPGRYFCSIGCGNVVSTGIRQWNRHFKHYTKEIPHESNYESRTTDPVLGRYLDQLG